MSELKIHDPNVVSIERHPGDKGFIIKYKDGTEKFVEDKPMKNPIELNLNSLSDKELVEINTKAYSNKNKYYDTDHKLFAYWSDIFWNSEELIHKRGLVKSNPRKKYRELKKPARPGNYQKIMKEIDEKPNEWRFRLLPPGRYDEDSFRYDNITKGVRAIAACRKGEFSRRRCRDGMEYQALRLSKEVFKTKESAAKWIAAHTMTKYPDWKPRRR